MKKIHIIFLAFTLFFLSSCFDIKDENTWIVGTSADNPPYEFMQDGKIVGFDIDLINEIAKTLNKKVELKNMELHSLLAAVSSKNVDIVIAGLTPTPEREEKVDFSIPYTSTSIAFLYRGEDNFAEPKDLKGKIVGAQLGSTWNIIANDLAEVNDFKVSSLASNLMLVEDLKANRIDAVVLEDFQTDKFIEIYPQLAKFTTQDLGSTFAVVLPKNSSHKKDIDEAIMALKSNGTIQTLSKKWGLIGAE